MTSLLPLRASAPRGVRMVATKRKHCSRAGRYSDFLSHTALTLLSKLQAIRLDSRLLMGVSAFHAAASNFMIAFSYT